MTEELGIRVVRARGALQRVRGVGEVAGIRIVVDSENKIVSVHGPAAHAVVEAYQQALADAEPQIRAAMRELDSDPRVEAISQYVAAQPAVPTDADEEAEWEAFRNDPLGRRGQR